MKSRPGRFAPACLVAALAAALSPPAFAQAQPTPPRPVAPAPAPRLPTPDTLTALKLLWSTMAAVDQANRTGNYSVLRDLGSAGFQANNNAATLAQVFASIRTRQVDLADTLLVQPLWEIAPTMISPTTLRMRGSFPLRPAPIQFDLLFSWERGWRLEGVAVQAPQSGAR